MPHENGRLCAYCRARPAVEPWAPFCSRRCRLVDLANWIDGKYRIAGEPVSPEVEPPDDALEAEK